MTQALECTLTVIFDLPENSICGFGSGVSQIQFWLCTRFFVVVASYFIVLPKKIYSHAFLRRILDWQLESSILGYMTASLWSQVKKKKQIEKKVLRSFYLTSEEFV